MLEKLPPSSCLAPPRTRLPIPLLFQITKPPYAPSHVTSPYFTVSCSLFAFSLSIFFSLSLFLSLYLSLCCCKIRRRYRNRSLGNFWPWQVKHRKRLAWNLKMMIWELQYAFQRQPLSYFIYFFEVGTRHQKCAYEMYRVSDSWKCTMFRRF